MEKRSIKSYKEMAFEEALEYLKKVKELEGLEEEYKSTYENRAEMGNQIMVLAEEILRLQGSFSYYLRCMREKYIFKEVNLVDDLAPTLRIIGEAANKGGYFLKYWLKNISYEDEGIVKTVSLLGDINILCMYVGNIYTKEKMKEIITELKQSGKSIVIASVYDKDMLQGFNKLKLNIVSQDGRMLFAKTLDDELGEVMQKFEDYLNQNNRHLEDVPRDVIIENIRVDNFKRTREI